MWNGTMFVDLDWPLNASSLLSASAELLVNVYQGASWSWKVMEFWKTMKVMEHSKGHVLSWKSHGKWW